jgi:hypothetical protein
MSIAQDDALILPHSANPDRMGFSGTTGAQGDRRSESQAQLISPRSFCGKLPPPQTNYIMTPPVRGIFATSFIYFLTAQQRHIGAVPFSCHLFANPEIGLLER